MRAATVITGASAGLGAEFARQCAARGDALVLVARRRDRLEQLAEEIGGEAHVLPLDLSTATAPAQLMSALAERGLYADTLINNAGFGLAGRFADLPQDRQGEMIDLNVRTLTMLAHLVLPGMIERGRGSILNLASTAAFQAGPGIAVYFATKAFVLSFTEALHQEVRHHGIKVSALCPGPTKTEFGSVAGVTSPSFQRLSTDAPSVVRAGLAGLDANQAVVVPGILNKLGAQGTRIMPRFALRRLVASLKL